MCKRHTTVPYEFHCVTDDVTGLNPDIHVIKFPKDVSWIKTWWSKLWMFSDALPIKGNVLYFDLDVIIHRNIDALFNYQGKFFCDNIDMKSTPEGLNNKFEVNIIARKSDKINTHKIYFYVDRYYFYFNNCIITIFMDNKKFFYL